MTKIYIYCLFDMDRFMGVYSSLKSVHRDALKLSNRGQTRVYMLYDGNITQTSLTALRNTLRGQCDVEVKYKSNLTSVSIFKTKLKE